MTTTGDLAQAGAHVRHAVIADLEALIALRRSMYGAMQVPAGDLDEPLWQANFAAWVADRLSQASTPPTETLIVVAEVGDASTADVGESPRVVACAIGEVTALIPGPQFATGRVGLLSNVSTLPEYRGRGLGAACTDAVLTWFREVKVERVDLFATAEGEPIYLRRGFERRRFPAMVRRESVWG